MQRPNQLFFLPLVGLFLMFQSCSIQKRHYLKGYYISQKTKVPEYKSISQVTTQTEKEELIASASNESAILLTKKSRQFPDTMLCDTIVLLNGKKLIGKITVYGSLSVKIKNCKGKSLDATEIPKSQIAKIIYGTGETDEISQEELKRDENKGTWQKDKIDLVHKKAGWGLGLSIASYPLWVVCLFIAQWSTFLFLLIPIIVAVIALALSIQAFAEMRKNKVKSGRGMAIAGIIIIAPFLIIGLLYALILLFDYLKYN